MQLCAVNVIAQINSKVGFEKVMRLDHIDAYFQAADQWDDAPQVVNRASDLFVNALGEKGVHSRAIFGVDKLPRNFSIENSLQKAMFREVRDKTIFRKGQEHALRHLSEVFDRSVLPSGEAIKDLQHFEEETLRKPHGSWKRTRLSPSEYV